MQYSSPINIGQVISIHAWLEAHPQSTVEPLEATPGDDADLIKAWLHAANGPEIPDLQRSVDTLLSVITLLSGLILGVTVISVALTYTGAYPVNLLLLLAVLVGLPGLTLLLTLVSTFVWRHRKSGPGSVLTWSLARLNPEYPEFLNLNLWRYGQCLYWYGQSYFQRFTLSFLSASLLTFAGLIAFSDIAFGWSSTLELRATTVFKITELLSLPWQTWLPAAHPSVELVEASRFFRMNPDNDPELLGQWWPFLGMCILVWGIGPRLLMALLARRRLQTSIRAALLNHPEVTALINLLRRAEVTYDTELSQQEDGSAQDSVKAEHDFAEVSATICWNCVTAMPLDAIAIAMGESASRQAELLAGLPDEPERVRIVVKGWEPPLLEFLDFVQDVRQQIGADADIAVQPLALEDHPLSTDELQAWRSILAKLHDSKIYVEVAA